MPAPTLHALGSGAGIPRCLLSNAFELLSSRLAGLGDPPGDGQGGGSTERAPTCPGRKRGAAPSLPQSYSIAHPSQGQSCALVCPTLQLAGAFDFPLQEGRRVVSQGHSSPCTSPLPPPALWDLCSPLLQSRAGIGCTSSPARGLLQRSHPGHFPYPRSWQGCYFTVILYVFLKISLC